MSKAMLRRADAQTIPISFTLNGRHQEVAVEPHELLLDVVRERLGLTGAKRSCDVQVCGACTVIGGRAPRQCLYHIGVRGEGSLGDDHRRIGRQW